MACGRGKTWSRPAGRPGALVVLTEVVSDAAEVPAAASRVLTEVAATARHGPVGVVATAADVPA